MNCMPKSCSPWLPLLKSELQKLKFQKLKNYVGSFFFPLNTFQRYIFYEQLQLNWAAEVAQENCDRKNFRRYLYLDHEAALAAQFHDVAINIHSAFRVQPLQHGIDSYVCPSAPNAGTAMNKGMLMDSQRHQPLPLWGQQALTEWDWKRLTTGFKATENTSCCKLIGNTNNDEFEFLVSWLNMVLIARAAQDGSSCFLKSAYPHVLSFWISFISFRKQALCIFCCLIFKLSSHKTWDQTNTYASSLFCIDSFQSFDIFIKTNIYLPAMNHNWTTKEVA